MAFNVKKHDKVYDRALEEIQENVFDNVKALENEVADIVAQGLPPEQSRPIIVRAFESHASQVKSSAGPLTNLSQDYLEQSDLPISPEDYTSESALLDTSGNELSSTIQSGSEDIVKTIVLGTVAGVGTQVLVNQVRGRISGVQMESADPNVRRQQRKLNKMMKKGATGAELAAQVAVIKKVLPGNVNVAASVATRMKTVVDNVVGEFNGTYAKGRATRNNIEMFEYVGPVDGVTRPFCADMAGARMSAEEIQNVWDSSGWQGKEPGDPFVVRGGYNCRHYWVPIEES